MKFKFIGFVLNNRTGSVGRLESWVVLLTIAGYPIVAGLSQLLGVENRPLSIAMRVVVLGIATLLIVRFFFSPICKKTISFWCAWWFFWCLYLFRLTLDSLMYSDSLNLPPSEYAIFSVGTCFIPALAVTLGNVYDGVNRSLKNLLWLLIIGLILNLYLIFFSNLSNTDIVLQELRVETETLNPITIGHLGVSTLLLVLWQANDCRRMSFFKIGLLCVFGMVAIVAIVASGSRGPIVAFIISTVVYSLMLPRHFFSRKTIFAIVCLILFGIYNSEKLLSTFFISRIFDHLFEDNARMALLNSAFEIIKNNLFLGGGIDPLETYPHNLIVESFIVYGLWTGFLFCYLVFFSLNRVRIFAINNSKQFWVAILFIQYFVAAMFSGAIYLSSIFWVLMALTVSSSFVRKNTLIEFVGK